MSNMKKVSHLLIYLVILAMAGILASCDSIQNMLPNQESTNATPAPVKPLLAEDSSITSAGRLVPRQTTDLTFTTAGQIEEVLIKEGDLVKKGQVLARLNGRKQLDASIAAVDYELQSALQARRALDDNLDQNRNNALQDLNNARQSVNDTKDQLVDVSSSSYMKSFDEAYSQLLDTEQQLQDAKDRFKPYENEPETDATRASQKAELDSAQQAYDEALSRYNQVVEERSAFDTQQARTNLEIAKKQEKLAQNTYDTLKNGPDPDQVESAEARIAASKARLIAANDDLAKLELIATIDGVVVGSDLLIGKYVSPGQMVVELADFSEWFVETEDLTEIEIVDVTLGQKVSINADALPEVKMIGEVVEISDGYKENRGDIVYTVRIKLDEIDPRLRWGMTVVTEFEKNK
jgi:HlyD family secretion protein